MHGRPHDMIEALRHLCAGDWDPLNPPPMAPDVLHCSPPAENFLRDSAY